MINRQNYKDVQKYLTYKKEVRKVAESSQTVYRTWLNYALEWADEVPFSECFRIKESLPDYLQKMVNEGKMSSYTAHKTCKNFREFLHYMKDEVPSRYEKLKVNFIKSISIKNDNDQTKPVKVYSLEEAIKIAELELPEYDLSLRRVQAGACFMYLSGMRIGALLTMPIEAVNLEKFKVYQLPAMGVHTKYGKKGITSIYRISQLLDVVKKWDDFMRNNYSEKNYWYPRLDRNKRIRPAEPVKGDVNKSTSDIHSVTATFYKNLEKLCLMAGVDYKSAHAFRYGHINFGMSHAKNMQEFKAVSLNVMHGSMDITDKIYSRMNIDTVNETITNLGFESTPLPVQKNSNDIPISELLASLPLEIREKIVREKLGLA